jgi:ankyrin repeat protein
MRRPGRAKGEHRSALHEGPPVSHATRRRHWLMSSLRAALVPALLLGSRAARSDAREDFFKSIELDNVQLLRPLLAAGFDPNTTDDRGNPGLLVAVRDGSFEAAELLLSAKQIQIDRANSVGETALMMAALRGHASWVGRLLDRGAAINRTGWTPLHYAASGPEPKVLTLLLERGAQLEASSANGTTPLMMAAGYGAMDGADLLLARGADPRRRNARGLNAADFARRAGRDALALRLETPVR